MVAKRITVNGHVYALVPTAKPEPKPKVSRIRCIQPGCYKEGHSFSPIGAFGDGTKKGHFDLNPTHAMSSL